DLCGDETRCFRKRTKANLLNDLVIAEARTHLRESGFTVLDECNLTCFGLEGCLLVRFKLLDRAGEPNSYPTGQQKRIKNQESLPGMPPGATWAYAGYRVSDRGDKLVGANISSFLADELLWRIDLNLGDAAASL